MIPNKSRMIQEFSNVLKLQYQMNWKQQMQCYLSTFPTRRFKVLDGDLKNVQSNDLKKKVDAYDEKYEMKVQKVMKGGGMSSIIRHTQKNKKILPRDRIKMLVDKDYPVLEIGMFAGLGMDYGDVCCAGTILSIAKVSGQLCIICTSDATVKGGTIFPIGVKKQLRMQEIAEQNNIPCVYLIDSGGGFLPLQSELFLEGGRVFYNEAIMNSIGIPQICVVAGSCTAGAAYIPTMANEVVMVDKIGTIFLAGPPLVYAAIGEQISDQDLGGAVVHCEVSGCADYKATDEYEAIEYTKDIMSTLNMDKYYKESKHIEEPFYEIKDLSLLSLLRDEGNKLYTRKILSRILDGSRFHEYKPSFGGELITGFARLNGILIAVLANNGCLSEQACLKGTNFVNLCDERGIPMLFLQDIMRHETEVNNIKLIKFQSELMSAVATSKVPKITLIIGNSYGIENYVMCGRSMGPNFLFLWTTSNILFSKYSSKHDLHDTVEQIESYESNDENEILNEDSCYYSSARLWDDGVILPEDSRKVLSLALQACITYKKVGKSSDKSVVRM